MTTSIGTIAQQALRRLGVRVVPLDDSPTLTELVPFSDIATGALIELGVLNADATLAPLATAQAADVVTTALIELGVLNSTDPFTPQPTIPVDNIAGAALIELGVIAADEVPSTSDLLLATEKVVVVHDGLHSRGIAKWESTAIPAAVAEEYIKLTAAMVASSFGKAVDPAVIALLEGRIRAGATVMTMVPVMMGHLTGVHQSLVARGIARWSIDTIPAAVAEEYHKLVVALAAASFGRPETDPAAVAALEDRIRQAAAVMTADVPFMLDKIASVHAALDAQGIVWWPSGSVPRAFTEEYVKLTAAMAAATFGKQVDPALVALLEARVRKGAMVLSSDDNAQQAVQAVHDDLVMRGCARWTVFDIPDAVGSQYVVLAADRLAPLFGMDTDPKDTALAMVALYRYVALPTSGETVATAYF